MARKRHRIEAVETYIVQDDPFASKPVEDAMQDSAESAESASMRSAESGESFPGDRSEQDAAAIESSIGTAVAGATDSTSGEGAPAEGSSADGVMAEPASIDAADEKYLRRWNRLVSRTNWEKGRIISDWRQARIAESAPATEVSDEAWSRRVGNVSPQHVGRLRRVWERFGVSAGKFDGLYWSHFLAALDWDDAEMWLEGAVQSRWSVSQMRLKRWETVASPDDLQPREEEIASLEPDEDSPESETPVAAETLSPKEEEKTAWDEMPVDEDMDAEAAPWEATETEATPAPAAAFDGFIQLPDDLAEAFETFKLAILRHKLDGWKGVEPEAILSSLEALRQLVVSTAAV